MFSGSEEKKQTIFFFVILILHQTEKVIKCSEAVKKKKSHLNEEKLKF